MVATHIFVICTPNPGGNDPIGRTYFSNGLKLSISEVLKMYTMYLMMVRVCENTLLVVKCQKTELGITSRQKMDEI